VSADRDELRDEAVARAWREHVRDEPPAALDDTIRAAARRAVGAKPQVTPKVAEAREPWRWWMPLAAAATIGAIAVGVMQNLPRDVDEPTVVSDAVNYIRMRGWQDDTSSLSSLPANNYDLISFGSTSRCHSYPLRKI